MFLSRLSLGLLFLLVTMALVEALDCRKFVFAPMCRGISAKRSGRSQHQSSNDFEDLDLTDLSRTPDSTVDWDDSDIDITEVYSLMKKLADKIKKHIQSRQADNGERNPLPNGRPFPLTSKDNVDWFLKFQ
ncbi:uncharacterized protein LOC111088935 [Limulus polyphemus]|uniref:Uncharacterized protein LOC111088935 n=1 Tax=Limulus polyphemus TaxID=6850 RepID=A0ABM1TJE0_LIMPO|nr:uncharacterized protein LOC111088935 [Limulus polyphemus]